MPADPEEQSRDLAAAAQAAGDPVGWFEQLYAAAERGEAVVPWDRETPNQFLVEWVQDRQPQGRSALVVGCGLGRDAEFIAGLGFDTVAFDVSATAVRQAIARHPDSPVKYVVADLLNPPAEWQAGFDLVVESMTVQALTDPPRGQAISNIADFVGPGGTLIAIALSHNGQTDPDEGPPWSLDRDEIDAFAARGLRPVQVEQIGDPDPGAVRRWRAEFHRPSEI
jgi:SAM-dependent methyltransferase